MPSLPSVPPWPQLPPVPVSPAVLRALADRIRERLAELGRVGRRGLTRSADRPDTVIVSAVAAFAPTAYARARLLRQLHASGLLAEHETRAARQLAGVPKAG